jgi:tyrosyl-tRNA synthetase
VILDGLKDGDPLLVSHLLVLTGLCGSRGEASRLIREGGAYLNNRRLTPPDELVFDYDLLHGTWVILRKGKKHVAAVEFTIDQKPERRDWWLEWASPQLG